MARVILSRNFCRLCSIYPTVMIPSTLNKLTVISPQNISSSWRNDFNIQHVRQKYSDKGKKKRQEYESDSDEENEEKYTSDRDSKIIKAKMNSLRADLILKTGLNIARNKIETHFYESKIRVNGEKLLKKSALLHIGDEIDIIRGPSPHNKEHLLISRVEILDASPRDEDLSVVLRRYKTMTIENYKDAWCSPSE